MYNSVTIAQFFSKIGAYEFIENVSLLKKKFCDVKVLTLISAEW